MIAASAATFKNINLSDRASFESVNLSDRAEFWVDLGAGLWAINRLRVHSEICYKDPWSAGKAPQLLRY